MTVRAAGTVSAGPRAADGGCGSASSRCAPASPRGPEVTQELVTADEAITYLSSLGRPWRETDDEARRILAVATFCEIRVRAEAARGSHRIVGFTLTPEAERHGLHLALRAPDAEDSPAGTAPRLRVVAIGAYGS